MIETGSIVKSLSGHDKGSWYVVVEKKSDFAYIADGRCRKVEKPKKKNIKHLSAARLKAEGESFTNKKLRTVLYQFNFSDYKLIQYTEESD